MIEMGNGENAPGLASDYTGRVMPFSEEYLNRCDEDPELAKHYFWTVAMKARLRAARSRDARRWGIVPDDDWLPEADDFLADALFSYVEQLTRRSSSTAPAKTP